MAFLTSWIERVQSLVAWAKQTYVGRLIMRYLTCNGPLMAAGMSYNLLFTIFAAVWLGFSLLGVWFSRNDEIWKQTVDFIAVSIPGLIDTGDGGAIDPSVLGNVTSLFSWTGVVALVSLLSTLFGWVGNVRVSIRTIFEFDQPDVSQVKVRLFDLVFTVGFGLTVVVSAVASAVASSMGKWLTSELGLSLWSGWLGLRGSTLFISLGLDFLVFWAMLRVVAGITVPFRPIWPILLLGSVATTGLKLLGTYLIGSSSSNPLLASFAVLIGILLWFHFLSQVILVVISAVAERVAVEPHRSRVIDQYTA